MRGFAFALVIAAAAPAFAQNAPAPAAPAATPKTKRICHWVETGNPLDNKRVCTTVALSVPVAEPAAPAQPTPAEVAMQAPPQPHP